VNDGLLSAAGAADAPPAPKVNDGLLSAAGTATDTVDAPLDPKENDGLLSVTDEGCAVADPKEKAGVEAGDGCAISPATSEDLFFFLSLPSLLEGRDPKAIGGTGAESFFSAAGIDPNENAVLGASAAPSFAFVAGVDPNENTELGALSVLLSTVDTGTGAGVEPKVKLGLGALSFFFSVADDG